MMVTDVQIGELTAHFKQNTIAGHRELGGHLEILQPVSAEARRYRLGLSAV